MIRVCVLWLFFALPLSGCGLFSGRIDGTSEAMASYETQQRSGFYRLLFDDFHSLSTDTLSRSAIAWKVLAAASVEYDRQENKSNAPMQEASYIALLQKRYGFLLPKTIANWPSGVAQPRFQRPIGLVSAQIENTLPAFSLEVSNNGCATCHAATLYDSSGHPNMAAWVGLPSSSINFGRYAEESFGALSLALENPDKLLTNIKAMFPNISKREMQTITEHYLPALLEKIPQLAATIGGFTPYSNGAAGLTNGVATIQFYLGVIGADRYDHSQVAFTSIPDLGGISLRTSVLADGVYTPPGWRRFGTIDESLSQNEREDALGGVITLVTVGTLGVEPDVAVKNVPRIQDVMRDLFRQYKPPIFPGTIDQDRANHGAAIYARACSGCHGSYTELDGALRLTSFPNLLVEQQYMGTDPVRWQAVGEDANSLFQSTALGEYLDAKQTGGYVATPLTSLWATAPYLHNGSVPTLWHLMNPDTRPVKFEVGGHRLDLESVGIAGKVDAQGIYRDDTTYEPWMLPSIYDTNKPGMGNEGHEVQFSGLNQEDKRNLLEFLKRL